MNITSSNSNEDDLILFRELGSSCSVIESNSFFAAVLNILALRHLYRLNPIASSSNVASLPNLILEYLSSIHPLLSTDTSYSAAHASSFVADGGSNANISLNPICNQFTSFVSSPVIDFVQFLNIQIFHSILGDPLNSFQLYTELDTFGSWNNILECDPKSEHISSFKASLTPSTSNGISPVFVSALQSLDRPFDYALYYNPSTRHFHILTYPLKSPFPFLFHPCKIDPDGYIWYEQLTVNDARVTRRYCDSMLNPLRVLETKDGVVVDFSDSQQIDKDFAIALAMQDADLTESMRASLVRSASNADTHLQTSDSGPLNGFLSRTINRQSTSNVSTGDPSTPKHPNRLQSAAHKVMKVFGKTGKPRQVE